MDSRIAIIGNAGWETVDLRISDDVGSYVCGFVYYTSLEWFWKRDKEMRVLFLHVPPLNGEEEVEKGVKITMALIEAIGKSSHLG